MRKTLIVILLVGFFFFLEFLCSSLIGLKYTPNLIILLVIFLNLRLGIRYSLLAAALGGLYKDSFGVYMFGFHIFSYVFSAYMTTLLTRFTYHKGSPGSLFFIVFVVCIVNLLTQCLLSQNFAQFDIVVPRIMAPELISTLVVTSYVFRNLRRCASKLFG